MTKEAQARKRQMRRAESRSADLHRREQMQAQYRALLQAQMQMQYPARVGAMRRNAALSERDRQARLLRQNNAGYAYDPAYGMKKGYGSLRVMRYGYVPNRKSVRRKPQERSAVRRTTQPVMTA